MNIAPISQINIVNFKHKYDVNPYEKSIEIIEYTYKKLGTKPFLRIFKSDGSFVESKMYPDSSRNILYSVSIENISKIVNYSIFFKDTAKEDLQNGKPYQINAEQLFAKALSGLNTFQQPIYPIKNGEVTAKILYLDEMLDGFTLHDKMKEPTIVIKDRIYGIDNKLISDPNVVGVFANQDAMNTICHFKQQLIRNTKIAGHINSDAIFEQLKNLNGQYIHLRLKDNNVEIEPATKDTLSEPIKYIHVKPWHMDFCDEILTSEQYKPNLVGPKAYNLHRLESMVRDKKIDVKIPPSIALPCGLLDEMTEYNEEQMKIILKKLEENNIDSRELMVRSAFNDEDLPNFSGAGIHDSTICMESTLEKMYHNIDWVRSPNTDYNYLKNYGITKEDEKPTVILQQRIDPEYKFTVFTKYDDKIRIEFASSEWDYREKKLYVLEYDRISGKLTNSFKMFPIDIQWMTFDENMEEVDFSKNKDLLKKFDKVVKNAMIIEKEFGHPQDIEGGLVGDDVWLWQTRNIVE